MSGNLTAPTKFAPTSVWNITDLDADFQAYADYINIRQITVDIFANRPAAGVAGRFYFATDAEGGLLYVDTGTAWQPLAASVASTAIFNPTITGYTLRNDFGSPTDTLIVNSGSCASDEAVLAARVNLDRAANLRGKITGTWVVGDNQPKLDVGTVAPSTWYNVFAILNPTLGVNDILFSTSVVFPTMPAGYTRKRRLGSFRTDGASVILPFVQRGDSFSWVTSVLEVNLNNPGTSAVPVFLANVPTGVEVQAVLLAGAQNDGNAGVVTMLVSDAATADLAPDTTNMTCASAIENSTAGFVRFGLVPVTVWTDTVGQIRLRLSFSDANVFALIRVMGWIDRRGQDGP